MKQKGILLIAILFTLIISLAAADRAVLVKNSLTDINACQGKLKLKLIRVWGGDKEVDENKFFKTPRCVSLDKNGLLYICDMHSHCIKVFESISGNYVRTLGQFGKGPADLYAPETIALTTGGDIWVGENAGFRIQLFSPEGKSKKITKVKDMPEWIGVTSNNNLAIYFHDRAINTGKLIAIFNTDGKVLRDIGIYHDKSKNYIESIRLAFAIDNSDSIYSSYTSIPLIRKYSSDGVLLLAITFGYPFETEPVEIIPNEKGDEINIIRENNQESSVVQKNKRGIALQQMVRKSKPRVGAHVIGIDTQKRIYAVTVKRLPSEKERFAGAIYGGPNGLNRSRVNYDIVENIDIYRVLVFSPEGKVIAEAQIRGYCDSMYINGNRLFMVDGNINQRVLEYEMSFEQ